MVVTLGKHKVRDRDNYVSKQLNPVFGRCSIWDNFKLLCHLVSYNPHVDIQMRRSEQGANHVTGAKYGKKRVSKSEFVFAAEYFRLPSRVSVTFLSNIR